MHSYNSYTPYNPIAAVGAAGGGQLLATKKPPSGDPLLNLDDEANMYCAAPAGATSLKRTRAIKGKAGRKAYPITTVGDSGGAEHQEMLQAQESPSGNPLLYLDEANTYIIGSTGATSLKRSGALKGRAGRKANAITAGASGGDQGLATQKAQETPSGDTLLYVDDEANAYSIGCASATSLKRAGAIKGKVGRKASIPEHKKARQVKEARPLLNTLRKIFSSSRCVSSKTGTPPDPILLHTPELPATPGFSSMPLIQNITPAPTAAPALDADAVIVEELRLFGVSLKSNEHERTAQLEFADISICSIEIVTGMWAPSSSPSLQNNTPIRERFTAPRKCNHHARVEFANISNCSIEIVPEMWTGSC